MVVAPDPDPEWHPIAARWFEALALSGQAAFYEPSDWMTAFAVAESMSLEFKPQPVLVKGEVLLDAEGEVVTVRFPPKASTLAAWLKASSSLLATEGDRRRASLELQRPVPEGGDDDADVSELAEYRDRLSS